MTAARFGNFKEVDPNTKQTAAISIAAGLVLGGLAVAGGVFLGLGVAAIAAISGLVALAGGTLVTVQRWAPAVRGFWNDTVLENWIYPSGLLSRADSIKKILPQTATSDEAIQSLSRFIPLSADDALVVRSHWEDMMKSNSKLQRLSARQFVSTLKAYDAIMKQQKLSTGIEIDKKGLLNRALEKTLEHGQLRIKLATLANRELDTKMYITIASAAVGGIVALFFAPVSAILTLTVIGGALIAKAVGQRSWGRALGMKLEKLAKAYEKDQDLAGYAADLQRTSVRMSAGDKGAKEKARKLLKAAPAFILQARQLKAAEKMLQKYDESGIPIDEKQRETLVTMAKKISSKAKELFDVEYVTLQEAAVRKLNRSGMLASTVGQHASEMTGKEFAKLTLEDIETALIALDPDIRMPSRSLITAMGGIFAFKALNINQVKELRAAEDYLELVRNNRDGGQITADDLNNAAKEFLWLSNAAFFTALGKALDVKSLDGKPLSGESLAEFSGNYSYEETARKEIRAAVELGADQKQNDDRAKLLTDALEHSSRYGKQVAEIEYVFGIGVDDKFIESTRQLTGNELQKRINDPDTTPVQKRIFTVIRERLLQLDIRFDPNADTQAYVSGGTMYYNKKLIMQLNMMRRDGQLTNPDQSVHAVIRAFMLHETTEAEMDKLMNEMLALSKLPKDELPQADSEMCSQVLGWLEKSGSDGQGQIFRDFFAEYVAGTYLLKASQDEKNAVYDGMHRTAAYMGSTFKKKMGYYFDVTQTNYRDPFEIWASVKGEINDLETAVKDNVGSVQEQRQRIVDLSQKYISVFASSHSYFSKIDVFAFYFRFLSAAMNGDADTALKILNNKRKENKAGEEQNIGKDEYDQLKGLLVKDNPLETQKRALAHLRNFTRGSLFLIGSYADSGIQNIAEPLKDKKEPEGKKEKAEFLKIIQPAFKRLIPKENKDVFVDQVIDGTRVQVEAEANMKKLDAVRQEVAKTVAQKTGKPEAEILASMDQWSKDTAEHSKKTGYAQHLFQLYFGRLGEDIETRKALVDELKTFTGAPWAGGKSLRDLAVEDLDGAIVQSYTLPDGATVAAIVIPAERWKTIEKKAGHSGALAFSESGDLFSGGLLSQSGVVFMPSNFDAAIATHEFTHILDPLTMRTYPGEKTPGTLWAANVEVLREFKGMIREEQDAIERGYSKPVLSKILKQLSGTDKGNYFEQYCRLSGIATPADPKIRADYDTLVKTMVDHLGILIAELNGDVDLVSKLLDGVRTPEELEATAKAIQKVSQARSEIRLTEPTETPTLSMPAEVTPVQAPVIPTPEAPAAAVGQERSELLAEELTAPETVAAALRAQVLARAPGAGIQLAVAPEQIQYSTPAADPRLAGHLGFYAEPVGGVAASIVLNSEKLDAFAQNVAGQAELTALQQNELQSIIAELLVVLAHENEHAKGVFEEAPAYRKAIDVAKAVGMPKIDLLNILLARAEAQDAALKRVQDVIQLVDQNGAMVPRTAIEILSNLLNSKSYSIQDADLAKIQGVIDIGSLDALRNEEAKVKSLPDAALSHVVLHIPAALAQDPRYQESLKTFISKGAGVMVHAPEDKGAKGENVAKIYYVGQLAAWLGIAEFAKPQVFGKFEFNSQAGYFAVREYLASELMKAIFSAIEAQQQVAVSA